MCTVHTHTSLSFTFCTHVLFLHLCTVAPVVEQFVFPKNLTRGKRLRVICTVTEGDLPIDVQWRFDGVPILSSGSGSPSGSPAGFGMDPGARQVTLRRIDQYTSLLAISNLDTTHAGNYSCLARNKVAQHVRSAVLTIRGQD